MWPAREGRHAYGRHATDVLTPNQWIIEWKSNVDETCKTEVYALLDKCSLSMKLGRAVGLLNGFGIVASRNAFMNCIVRNQAQPSKACDGVSNSSGGELLFYSTLAQTLFSSSSAVAAVAATASNSAAVVV